MWQLSLKEDYEKLHREKVHLHTEFRVHNSYNSSFMEAAKQSFHINKYLCESVI